MSRKQITKIWIAIFVIISSILLGLETSSYIGSSLCFSLWAIAGMLELLEDNQ